MLTESAFLNLDLGRAGLIRSDYMVQKDDLNKPSVHC